MPLSDHEQRLLEQIERALYEDDPKFASSVRSTDPRAWLRRRIAHSAELFIAGIVALVVAVAINAGGLVTVLLGVGAFALMLYAALRLANDIRRLSARNSEEEGAPNGPMTRLRERVAFLQRAEQRWRKRWEDREDRDQ
jgi:uncharacterized protein (DUF58 family)